MNILLIGYGKMGQTIEKVAEEKGHTIIGKISSHNAQELQNFSKKNTDVAIEFTRPEAAVNNIMYCLKQGIPVVSGSTGWLEQLPEVKEMCRNQEGAFFYASNFSVGVNLFFHFNAYLASKLKDYPAYDVKIREIHHLQKLDHPSGTAITTAEGILPHYPDKTKWVAEPTEDASVLEIESERLPDVVGTHIVTYSSEIDTIELSHVAHSRLGFAQGAVMAAAWLPGKTGVFGMKDLLNL